MRIRFFQAGGLRGQIARQPYIVDEAELSSAEREDLARLVHSAKICRAEMREDSVIPDQMYYRVECEDADGVVTSWEASDHEMPEPLRPLVAWLRKRRKQ